MTFSQDCIEIFGTNDLYKILHLDRRSKLTATIIKKAYYEQSILWHPDRFSASHYSETDKQWATKKFQIIGRVYSILSQQEKRELYDKTGVVDGEDDEVISSEDWLGIWRGMFHEVTKSDIDEYFKKYKGSEEEMDDVKKAYIKHKGNMNKILGDVMGAEVCQEDRIRETILHFIQTGQVEPYPKFVNEPQSARIRRIKKAEKEAKEAEKLRIELQKKEEKNKGKRKVDFLQYLEQKYGSSNKPVEGGKRSKKCLEG